MLRPKHALFAAIFVMMGYVLIHNERFLVEPENPFRAHFATYGAWIWLHGLAGAAAMILAPLQFSDRLRNRYTTLHHVSGYVYVTGLVVLAPMGVYIQYIGESLHAFPRSFTVLAVVNAVMLWVVTGVALVFARRRRIALHRQLMTRSYAVALVFFEGRFILGVTGLETASVEIVQAVIWGCLAMAVILADVANDWFELRRPATAVAPSRAGASRQVVTVPSA